MSIPIIRTEDYQYDLPQNRIAQYPMQERDASKLLIYRQRKCITDTYKNIASYLPADSLLIFNNSKVIPARLRYVKATSGVIEIFCLEPLQSTPYEALQHKGLSTWICMIGGLKKWNKATSLQWQLDQTHSLSAQFIKSNPHGFEIVFSWTDTTKTFAEILDQLGQMPIPPYLLRNAEQEDYARYQTVYASVEGSVAAPTAGLHFTDQVLRSLDKYNISQTQITLHVGAGTFKPMDAEYAHEHQMHAEWVEINLSALKSIINAKEITCVGTTSLRSIESLYWYALECYNQRKILSSDYILKQFIPYLSTKQLSKEVVFTYLLELMVQQDIERIVFRTELIILPGYRMLIANNLITNFHQPKSTLLLLVDAFTNGQWRKLYNYALENEFRFLSYGDGCLLLGEEFNLIDS